MMSIFSFFWNSSLVICNFSGRSHGTHACMGGSLVVMDSCTPCLGEGLVNEDVVLSGNSARSLTYSSTDAMKSRWGADVMILRKLIDLKSEGSISL